MKPHCLVSDVHKTYRGGEAPFEALCGVTLEISKGEFVAIMGPSGCGKSTLLHLCGAMDRPTSGSVILEGQALEELSEEELTGLRRRQIGFVFQFFNLLPTLTVVENVALPLRLSGSGFHQSEQQARTLLALVSMEHRLNYFPQQLSGGEMQRVAVARAIVHSPVLLIADEPTGNLDSGNGETVMHLLSDLNRTMKLTILLATHSPEVAHAAGRVIHLRDGRVEREEKTDSPAEKGTDFASRSSNLANQADSAIRLP